MKKIALFLIAFIALSIHFSMADDGGSSPETTVTTELRDKLDTMGTPHRMPPLKRSIIIHYINGILRFECATEDNYAVKVTHHLTMKEWSSEINLIHPTMRIEEIPGTYTIEARTTSNLCFVGELEL